MKYCIVLAALLALATADLVVGPSARTTITGPDGGQIIKDEISGTVLDSHLVYTAPSVPLVRYAYSGYPYHQLPSSFYPSYRFVRVL